MKTYIPVLISVVLASTSVSADNIYNGLEVGNDDLYTGGGSAIPLAVQPGTGDSYGSPFSHAGAEGFARESSTRLGVDIYGALADGNSDLE